MSRLILLLTLLINPLLLWSSDLRVTADEVHRRLGPQQPLILDTRSAEDYALGHIPGALNFPVKLTYRDQGVSGQIVQPDVMQQLLRERGIDIDSEVVIHDDGSLIDAARLFWALEVYGLARVKVMDHGFDYWKAAGYPVSTETPKPAPSAYVATINHQRLASKFTTLLATRGKHKLIIDARNEESYLGKQSSAKRFGHIPKAINIPSVHNFDRHDNLLQIKPIEELKKLYAGVSKDQKIIVYCAIGRASAANYLALREIGLDVANYDASWREWGNDLSLPIETPKP
jgi:thiosulfate/3-mercaptopyruvate sulfurtransferase